MIAARIACFTGFAWELFRVIVIFYLGAIAFGGERLEASLWCAAPLVVMPAGLFFLGLSPAPYAVYAKLLAVGKLASIVVGALVLAPLAGVARFGAPAALPMRLRSAVTIAIALVLLVDLMLFLFLLFFARITGLPARDSDADSLRGIRGAGRPS